MDAWDLYEAAGPRYPWLVCVENWQEQRDEARYLPDIFRGRAPWDGMDDGSAEWQAVEFAWDRVRKCVRQCEAMLALMPADRATRIIEQHQAGLVPLYREVRDALRKCGVRFLCDVEKKGGE